MATVTERLVLVLINISGVLCLRKSGNQISVSRFLVVLNQIQSFLMVCLTSYMAVFISVETLAGKMSSRTRAFATVMTFSFNFLSTYLNFLQGRKQNSIVKVIRSCFDLGIKSEKLRQKFATIVSVNCIGLSSLWVLSFYARCSEMTNASTTAIVFMCLCSRNLFTLLMSMILMRSFEAFLTIALDEMVLELKARRPCDDEKYYFGLLETYQSICLILENFNRVCGQQLTILVTMTAGPMTFQLFHLVKTIRDEDSLLKEIFHFAFSLLPSICYTMTAAGAFHKRQAQILELLSTNAMTQVSFFSE